MAKGGIVYTLTKEKMDEARELATEARDLVRSRSGALAVRKIDELSRLLNGVTENSNYDSNKDRR